MDKLNSHRQVIQEIVKRYAKHKPSHGNIESIPICDTFQDNYLLMDLGWDDTGRVHSVILHVRIRDEKIWVEWDGTEQGIAEELLAAGIPKEEIVRRFLSSRAAIAIWRALLPKGNDGFERSCQHSNQPKMHLKRALVTDEGDRVF